MSVMPSPDSVNRSLSSPGFCTNKYNMKCNDVHPNEIWKTGRH
jgi:hypothetical protein